VIHATIMKSPIASACFAVASIPQWREPQRKRQHNRQRSANEHGLEAHWSRTAPTTLVKFFCGPPPVPEFCRV